MNDFVLRGFCQTCGFPVYLNEEKAYHSTTATSPLTVALYGLCKEIKPVYFLSVKQMDIITASKEFSEFVETNEVYCWINPHDALAEFLKRNPFLVAKILKEVGEKEGENK